MVRVSAVSSAAPEAAWALVARPARWPKWSLYVRGDWGLAGPDGEVQLGARGAARLLGAIPVPARITAVDPGRSWTWRVGPVDMVHEVTPVAGGTEVGIVFNAAAPLESALKVTYAPVCKLLMERLARIAAEES